MTKLTLNFYKRRIEQEKQLVNDLKEDGHYKEAGEVSDHIQWLRKQQELLTNQKSSGSKR